jgi:hypothetical protein
LSFENGPKFSVQRATTSKPSAPPAGAALPETAHSGMFNKTRSEFAEAADAFD